MKPIITPEYIILKEDLTKLCSSWNNPDLYNKCIGNMYQLWTDIKKDIAKNNPNYKVTKRRNYASCYFQIKANIKCETIFKFLNCILLWISAFSGRTCKTQTAKLAKALNTTVDHIRYVVSRYGSEFNMSIENTVDKFRVRKENVVIAMKQVSSESNTSK